MSGISMIQDNLNNRVNRTGQSNSGKEVWLKDGDEVFMKPIATGQEDDPFLEQYHVYEFQSGPDKRIKSVLVVDGEPVEAVPTEAMSWEDGRRRLPSNKFAIWAYVDSIIHTEQRVDTWEEVVSATGVKKYKETVQDFKVFSLKFGRGNGNWGQLVDIFNDIGTLDKFVVSVKRRGASIDTTYTITNTNKELELPEDKQAEIKNLMPMKDYLDQRYGGGSSVDTSVPDTAVSVDDDDDMPF